MCEPVGCWATEHAIATDHSHKEAKNKVLSRDCDGCSHMKACSRRFVETEVYEKVYCPDGTAHLVDGA